MDVVVSVAGLRVRLTPERQAARRIALVPTMGALHDGHLALVDEARRIADVVVMSVFVNPLQFLPGEDLDRYPRPFERDRALAEARGVDVLFHPGHDEMYPGGQEVTVVAAGVADRWEGRERPGHFTGVLTVVAKLFNMVQPDVALFGQKDIQQVVLVRRMVADLDFPVQVHMVATVREPDGLARSSRNIYLTAEQRPAALGLIRALEAVNAEWTAGTRDAAALRRTAEAALDRIAGLHADYIAVADPERLAPVDDAPPGTVVAIAARVGSTRLIDNIVLGGEAD